MPRRRSSEALQLGRDAGSLDLEASALEGLAALHLDLGDIAQAADFGRQALEVAVRTSHPRTEASVMATLATIARAEGDYSWRDHRSTPLPATCP